MSLVHRTLTDKETVIKRPDSAEMRAAIFRAEDILKTMPQGEAIITHRFAPGVYTKEMYVPAGCMITGAIHKTEHISIFLEGKMLVPDETGKTIEINGPIVEVAKPGIKRIGIVLEPVRWITIHATDVTDLDELDEMLLTNDPHEAEILADQYDYASLNIPDEDIEQLKTVEFFPGEQENVEIRESERHGLGLFVRGFVPSGDIIAPAFKDGKLMEYSRYTNHSANPNAVAIDYNGVLNLVATRNIEDEEVTIDYRTSHRKGLKLDVVLDKYRRGLECHR